ncbi:MAG: N-acetylneuraminate synthase [Candidatus Omnitrophica bacterium]|nr:N-acetylneuraminate synthase [Candidatus Omnitrophota bacterium]
MADSQGNTITIGGRIVGEAEPVFIIAEAGVNHNGDIELAKRLVDIAKESGADAVKFQTFKTENIIIPSAPKSTYHIETTGAEQSWFELLKTQELDKKAHRILFEYCKKREIVFLSTPYDEESADLLEELPVSAFKVASTDANNIPFLRYLARKRLPIILSTGMCTLGEVRESVEAIKSEGCQDLMLLHCTADYPAKLEDANLRAMLTLKNEFNLLVGYSDHIPDCINPIAATALGARVYEKHFTLDKSLPGPDHRASLNPKELKELVDSIRKTEAALGSSVKKCTSAEQENRIKLRKSILTKVDIPKDTPIDSSMIEIKRPGFGLEPKYYHSLIGKKVRNSLSSHAPITYNDIIWEDLDE